MAAHRKHAAGRRGAVMVLFLIAAALLPAALAAQIAVFPVQDLSFGTLRAGAAEQVATGDRVRRAELELVGTGNAVITFGLPAEMVSMDGHRLPLSFTRGDALLEYRNSGRTRSFDPNRSRDIRIRRRDGGARIYLGGLALPTASQPPGRYRATITVQVVTPGT